MQISNQYEYINECTMCDSVFDVKFSSFAGKKVM